MGWTIIGALAALLTTFGFVPQVLQMWRTRSVRDVSLLTLLQFLAGIALWTAYVIHLGDAILIVSNFFALAILLFAVGSYLVLRRWQAPQRHLPDQDAARALPSRRDLE